jgi:ABC-2 type transport system ATP-binding protein
MTLQVDEISKRYDPPSWLLRPVVRSASNVAVEALRGVTFEVLPGEVVGLIGPNGAGKTTLLKIVSTLLLPSSGRVMVDGIDAVRRARQARERLGLVLTEDRSTYWRLDGRANLEFFGVLGGLPPQVARRRADEMLERLGLSGRDRRVMGYSSGMRSALGIARAILTEPSVIVLDEPTRSLDPIASVEVGALLREQAAEGRSVLFSSHRMDEVVDYCDRVLVLVDGTLRHVGPANLGDDGEAVRHLRDLLMPERSGLDRPRRRWSTGGTGSGAAVPDPGAA